MLYRTTHPLFIALAIIALFFGPAPGFTQNIHPCSTRTTAPPDAEKALDAVLQQFVATDPDALPQEVKSMWAKDYGSAPGAVLSVEGPGWRYVKSAGLADITAGTPIDCAMPFEIGSNTKMMTAAVLLMLQEEGKLSIDDPLSRHLPEIAARLPHGSEMTLRQLAQHTSGAFDYADTAEDGTPGILEGGLKDKAVLTRQVTPDEMLDYVVKHGKPHFDPGAKGAWRYSNTGYILLGMVIEKIEGRALDKILETRIFTPLGMTHAYLWNSQPRAAFGLPRAWAGAPFDVETTGWNMSQGWAAGGVISTPDDMHLFITALLGGKLFKSASTLETMKVIVPSQSDLSLGYGIGLKQIDADIWGHGGQTLGFLSSYGASQDGEISYVAWSNSSTNILAFGDMLIARALRNSGLLQSR